MHKFKLITALCVLSFGAAFIFGGSSASAQESDTENNETQAATAYEYVAEPGDNLSYMVRRSVQLYNEAKETEMSEAAAMYCETNVVQRLGSKRLDVNERVSVPFDLLQSYIVRSRDLTSAQLAAWQQYADLATFSLPGVNPVNAEEAETATTPGTSSTNSDEENDDTATNDEDEGAAADSEDSRNLIWWVLGAGAVIIASYYAVEAQKQRSQKGSKGSTINSLWSKNKNSAKSVKRTPSGRTKSAAARTRNKRKRS